MRDGFYHVNKGINRSIEFRGLRAQYIWYMAVLILLLLGIFGLLYALGVNQYVCLVLIGLAGSFAAGKIFRMSRRYGEHGLLKSLAKRRMPKAIKIRNRRIFYKSV